MALANQLVAVALLILGGYLLQNKGAKFYSKGGFNKCKAWAIIATLLILAGLGGLSKAREGITFISSAIWPSYYRHRPDVDYVSPNC